MRKLKELYQELRHPIQMAFVYLGTTALDFLSSLHIKPPHEESNPFARHADGSFWVRHALINCTAVTLETLVLSAAFFLALRPLGRKAALVASGLPWLYFAYGHLDAAISNMQMAWPGLYVETYHDMLKMLMGGL